MPVPPLHYRSIAALGRAIRTGELSPVELTRHALERVERLDGGPADTRLGAFRLVCAERALAQAEAAERQLRAGVDLGPLHGIPYAVKDIFDVRGLPTSAGTHLLEDNVAAGDSHAVRQLERAGMILVGKCNTVQFAYGGVGINHDHGTPRNPWSATHHVPGGSSSGSAVAVAAGLVPAALGSDTGGSVRIPASLCGITGLKSTVGRVGRGGVYPLSWSLDSVGALTRTVEDAALLHQALQGHDPEDEATHGVSPHDVLGSLGLGVRGLRLAFAETAFWDEADPEVARAVRGCAEIFEELGARVGSIDFPEAAEAHGLNPAGLVIAAEAYAVNRKWLDGHFDELDPVVAHRAVKGRDVGAAEYLGTVRAWREMRARATAALADVDALLCPTTMIPALPLARVDMDKESYSKFNVQYLRNTAIGNILNLCGLSLPCGFTSQGLPIGLMIYGKPFDEATILRAGHAYQLATDWHTRSPA